MSEENKCNKTAEGVVDEDKVAQTLIDFNAFQQTNDYRLRDQRMSEAVKKYNCLNEKEIDRFHELQKSGKYTREYLDALDQDKFYEVEYKDRISDMVLKFRSQIYGKVDENNVAFFKNGNHINIDDIASIKVTGKFEEGNCIKYDGEYYVIFDVTDDEYRFKPTGSASIDDVDKTAKIAVCNMVPDSRGGKRKKGVTRKSSRKSKKSSRKSKKSNRKSRKSKRR